MPTTATMDLYKVHKEEYAARPEPRIVKIAPARYLGVEGRGEPGGIEFASKMSALFSLLYTLKFAAKKHGCDFKVAGAEGLWWTPTGGDDYVSVPRSQWCWKLIARVPEFVSDADLDSARMELLRKKKTGDFDEVKLETLDEGRCVQALHVGPYADERETLARMDELVQGEGLIYRGKHHEIYLSDPRRVAPSAFAPSCGTRWNRATPASSAVSSHPPGRDHPDRC